MKYLFISINDLFHIHRKQSCNLFCKHNPLLHSFIPLIALIFFYEDKSFPQREFFWLTTINYVKICWHKKRFCICRLRRSLLEVGGNVAYCQTKQHISCSHFHVSDNYPMQHNIHLSIKIYIYCVFLKRV